MDGVTAVDTGSNNGAHYQPNMDTVAEVKVLTSNYQAEYGRSAGGLISVITKGGTQQFHGTGWWTHRHESFNANNFFRNRSGLAKAPYRYNIAGFSAGGPITVPGRFNSDRSKLFFSLERRKHTPRFGRGSLAHAAMENCSMSASGLYLSVLDFFGSCPVHRHAGQFGNVANPATWRPPSATRLGY